MTTPTHPQQVAKSASAKNADERSDANGRHFAHSHPDRGGFGFIAPNFFTESNLLNITRRVDQHRAGGRDDLHHPDRGLTSPSGLFWVPRLSPRWWCR